MIIIRSSDFNLEKPAAVTIGKFEAIHTGHNVLLSHTEHYKKKGYSSVLFTFDVHPNVQFGDSSRKMIYTYEEKERFLDDYSIDYLIEYPFDEKIINMSPREFFEHILINKVNAKTIIVGEDFKFGHNRSGDVSTLELLCDEYNIKVDVVSKQCIDEEKISSTQIRESIIKGDMAFANDMLGRPYSISGQIVHGNKIGRTIGMPTINIIPDDNKLLPPFGVYSAKVVLNGIKYNAVANIGLKPTIKGDNSINVEAYIFDFSQDIYGETVTIELYHYQRAEKKFDSLEQLKEQMYIDKRQAYILLNG